MAWAYLIVFNQKFASREQVQAALSQIQEVTYWYACLPYCVFATSTLTADALAKALETKFNISQGERFLVTEIAKDRQGRLPKAAWHLFRNPENPKLPGQ